MLRVLVVAIAIFAGGGAGWLALTATWREQPATVTIMLEEEKVDVLTSNVDLLRGARVEAGHLTWTSWPATQVSPGMILKEQQPESRDELAGRVLRSNLYTGEPVRMQHLATGAGGFLSMVLQPGQRAIGLVISEDKTAGGFILPNDRVDVLHTVTRDVSGSGRQGGSTRTILTNVRVLAIGQTTFEGNTLVVDDSTRAATPTNGSEGTTLMGRTATLEVTAEQAEVLLAAAASGQLALVLRAADDFGLSGIGDLSLIAGFGPENEVSPAPEPEADATDATPRQREVTIISAGVSQVVVTTTKEVR